MVKQATKPELAFWSASTPGIEALAQISRAISQRRRNPKRLQPQPAFVIKCKDFDEPRSPDSAPCKLLPRVEESDVFPANLVLLWRGKLVWKELISAIRLGGCSKNDRQGQTGTIRPRTNNLFIALHELSRRRSPGIATGVLCFVLSLFFYYGTVLRVQLKRTDLLDLGPYPDAVEYFAQANSILKEGAPTHPDWLR